MELLENDYVRETDRPGKTVPKRRGSLYATQKVLSHLIGVSSEHHNHHEVPPGYILTHDKKGIGFIFEKKEYNIYGTHRRRKEWVSKGMGCCTPVREVANSFGEGIYCYFDFLRFITLSNMVLSLVMIINIVPHFMQDHLQLFDYDPRKIISNFYISTYSPELYLYWFWSCVLSTCITFTFGPIFSLRIKAMFKRLFNHHDHEDKFDTQHLDIIMNKDGTAKHTPGCPNVIRTFFSYVIFLAMLVVSTILFALLNVAQLAVANNFGYSVGVIIFVLGTNAIWWKLCEVLTKFEGHYTWSQFRKHLTIKYYFFKVLNLSVIFISRYIVRTSSDWFNFIPLYQFILKNATVNISTTCTLELDSEQFLLLIISEMIATRFTAVIGPWLYYTLWTQCNETGPYSDRGRPIFDLPLEYLEILYRQYIIYLGITVFPWISFLGVIGNLIDYPINKWYLLNIAHTPPHLRGSMRSFLVFFMFMTSLLSLVVFPQGVFWVLTGWYYEGTCPNSIFHSMDVNSSVTINK